MGNTQAIVRSRHIKAFCFNCYNMKCFFKLFVHLMWGWTETDLYWTDAGCNEEAK